MIDGGATRRRREVAYELRHEDADRGDEAFFVLNAEAFRPCSSQARNWREPLAFHVSIRFVNNLVNFLFFSGRHMG